VFSHTLIAVFYLGYLQKASESFDEIFCCCCSINMSERPFPADEREREREREREMSEDPKTLLCL